MKDNSNLNGTMKKNLSQKNDYISSYKKMYNLAKNDNYFTL